MAVMAPLGKRYVEGPSLIAVVFAGHTKIKVLGLFTALMPAVAFVKANYRCEPLGKTRFVTDDGEVLIVQEHIHVLNLEET